jgi:hypothetical protein
MFSYTNDQYRPPSARQGQGQGQTNQELLEGLDIPRPGEELTRLDLHSVDSMTPVPGQDQNQDIFTSPTKLTNSTVNTDADLHGGDMTNTTLFMTYNTDTEDDDLYEPPTTLQPMNIDDLPAPTSTFLAQKLPPELHPFLAQSCKKDCRMWLWKNGIGRRAREVLGKGNKVNSSSGPAIPTVLSQTDSTLSGNANTKIINK